MAEMMRGANCKMTFNPAKHHRHSIRLPGFDYSQPGAYFVTICVQNRECLFGEIIHGRMHLNDSGKMIDKWYMELPNKFSNMEIDEYVIMPNHFHSIVKIIPAAVSTTATVSATVGADLCVRPNHARVRPIDARVNGADTQVRPYNKNDATNDKTTNLSSIMQWFKTMTTNEYIRNVKTNGWRAFSGKLWQRDFYEHIGRNGNELFRIRNYIRDNPKNWKSDGENPSSNSLHIRFTAQSKTARTD
jgi:putative transposase